MIIKLTKGKKTIIDDSDWEIVKNFSWHFSCGYAVRSIKIDGNNGTLALHRFLMNTPKGFDTDHINGDKLDNRRSNLRICTRSQNSMNSRRKKYFTSKYKGVSWYKRDKCWRSYVNLSGKQFHLGYFDSEIQAAKAYDMKAIEIYGNFACLNF